MQIVVASSHEETAAEDANKPVCASTSTTQNLSDMHSRVSEGFLNRSNQSSQPGRLLSDHQEQPQKKANAAR